MQPAESGLFRPDPEPDLDNANVGKYASHFAVPVVGGYRFFLSCGRPGAPLSAVSHKRR